MPKANKSRINQYQHELSKIKWEAAFSTNSVTFECVGDSTAVQQSVVSKLYCTLTTKQKQFNTISFWMTRKTANISPLYISIVEAFVNQFQRTLIRDIIDLIVFMYAMPIMIKLQSGNIRDNIPFCCITDDWNTLSSKIKIKFPQKLNTGKLCLHYEYAGKQQNVDASDNTFKNQLSDHGDKIFTITWSIIDQIDDGLKQYYQQLGRDDYTNSDGIGTFKQFVQDNGFEDEDVKEELDVSNANDCTLTDFYDENSMHINIFPLHPEIENNKDEEILRILKCIRDNGYYEMPPILESTSKLVIERMDKIRRYTNNIATHTNVVETLVLFQQLLKQIAHVYHNLPVFELLKKCNLFMHITNDMVLIKDNNITQHISFLKYLLNAWSETLNI
eukprot:13710_1